MRVIGCADADGINVGRFLIQHLAEVFVPPRLGMSVISTRSSLVVHIAECNVIGAKFGEGGNVAAAHSARTDSGDSKRLAGCDVSRAAKHMAWNDGETEGCRCGGRDESATIGAQTLRRGPS